MASTIKVDNVQNQPGTNIVSKCGTDVTLGASGDTVALACGASQTGFGRTGTVDWITTPKVTGDSPVTGVTGKGYFLNTTAGTITLNLPAGTAGDIISMADYAATWQTNNVTVSPNGSEKIGGTNVNATLSTEGQSVTFIYVDSTQGWVNVQDSTSNVRGASFIVATGGTPCSGAIVCTNYKVHTFTGPGTFCVSCGGNAGGSNTVDYLVTAGGGGGGAGYGGGGGAGGFRESSGTATGCYTASPLGGGVSALPVTATPYAITVGGGGSGATLNSANDGTKGGNSIFSSITSTGGGTGASHSPNCNVKGGSGAGGSVSGPAGPATGGTGNSPPATPSQGFPGGDGHCGVPYYGSGGGGGATEAGTNGNGSISGRGGAGATSSINGTPTARAGGAGGGSYSGPPATGPGPVGAGSPCGTGGAGGPASGQDGTVNTGGGGGGGTGAPPTSNDGGDGGSGVVIIRYKFQ